MQPRGRSAAQPQAVCHAFLERAEPVWGLLDGAPGRDLREYCRGLESCRQPKIRTHDPPQLEEPSSVDRAWGLSSGLEGGGGGVPAAPPPLGQASGESVRFGGDEQDAGVVV
ncbi:hypothetical protein I79_014358 [Cricetulus griseus]|uniref:Uncharacterized protein n=1 Tax=Cricetulus griseus TaxID=10029 RepID=G3HTX8_CRIGR|nr:hypothetical protein I79_014358 [Cricetulus griseus]